MSTPLHRVQRICERLGEDVAEAFRRLLARLKAAWRRHQAFMNDQASYRAQVVAGVTAIAAAFELDPRVAAMLLAGFGLHASVFGHSARPIRRDFEDDDRWDPFN